MLIATMQITTTSASIKAHSTAVIPSSPFKNGTMGCKMQVMVVHSGCETFEDESEGDRLGVRAQT